VVNFNDLLVLAKNYNAAGATYAQGDFNYDGVVNFNDLLTLAKNYNKTMAAPVTAAPALARAVLAVASTTASVSAAAPAAAVTATAVTTARVAASAPGSVLHVDKKKPVFSTQRIAKPAPVKAKAVARRR
jgi:hypothetical protein